jgi:hypothetical protein
MLARLIGLRNLAMLLGSTGAFWHSGFEVLHLDELVFGEKDGQTIRVVKHDELHAMQHYNAAGSLCA